MMERWMLFLKQMLNNELQVMFVLLLRPIRPSAADREIPSQGSAQTSPGIWMQTRKRKTNESSSAERLKGEAAPKNNPKIDG